MKSSSILLFGLTAGLCLSLQAQPSDSLSDEAILGLYEGLRVADVSDGMDMVGLADAGLMEQRIEAL